MIHATMTGTRPIESAKKRINVASARAEGTLEALHAEQRPSCRKMHTEALEIIERRIAGLKKLNP